MHNADNPDVIAEYVQLEGENGTLGGYLAKPAGKGPYPGVLVIHDIYGITDHTKKVAQDLAKEGFVGLSVNLVSRSLGIDFPGGSDEVKESLKQLADADAMSDLDAGLAYLKKEPVVFTNSVGCMGFCMGGRFSLLFGAHNKDIKAVVAFYGPPIDKEVSPKYPQAAIDLVPEIEAPVLGNYGTEDHVIPVENVLKFEEKLRKHNKVFDIKIYPGAKHGFHKEGPSYHAEAANDAWKRTINWFKKYLKTYKQGKT